MKTLLLLLWFKVSCTKKEKDIEYMLSRFQEAMAVKDVTHLSDEEPVSPKTPAKPANTEKSPEAPKKPQKPKASPKEKTGKEKAKAKPKGNAKTSPKAKATSTKKRPAAATEEVEDKELEQKDDGNEEKEEQPSGNKRRKSNTHVHDEPVSKCHKCFYKKTGVYGLKIVTAKGSSEIMQAGSMLLSISFVSTAQFISFVSAALGRSVQIH